MNHLMYRSACLILLLGSGSVAWAVEKVQIFAVPYAADTKVILSTLRVGQAFDLAVFVRDLRPRGTWTDPHGVAKELERGVYAAYVDVPIDDTVTATTGGMKFGEAFANGRRLRLEANFVNDCGGFSAAFQGTGTGAKELFRVRLKGVAPGTVVFAPSVVTLQRPECDTLVFGNLAADPPEPSYVAVEEVKISAATVTVLP